MLRIFSKKEAQITHLGFVVNDLDETVKRLVNLLGIGPWTIRTPAPPLLWDMTVHGKKVSHSFRVAHSKIGNLGIELLTPIDGHSVLIEHLNEKGEGFHHAGITVPDEEELMKKVEELQNEGSQIIQSGRVGNYSFYCYVDVKEMNLILELSTGKTPPLPSDTVYP